MLVRLPGMIEKRSKKKSCSGHYRVRSGTFGNRDDRVDLIGSVNPASPAQNQFDLELWYKVFFFTDSCRLDITIKDSG